MRHILFSIGHSQFGRELAAAHLVGCYLLPAHWVLLLLLLLLLKLFHTANEMEMNRSIDRQRRLLCTTFQAIDRSTFVCAYFLAIFNLLLLPVDVVVVAFIVVAIVAAIVADCCCWSWTDRADRSDLIVVIVVRGEN